MSNLNWLVGLSLTAVLLPAAQAEPHCPGNVDSLPMRLIQHSQIVVQVTINHTGPYDFMVDTGAQVTTVDPALAAELHLETRGRPAWLALGSTRAHPSRSWIQWKPAPTSSKRYWR